MRWPGQAAVIVSVVHVFKGNYSGPSYLDEREVPTINAFLFHRGGSEDPKRLKENSSRSFQGPIVLGMGFTFDDSDTTGTANSINEMHRLIARNPQNAEVIFPYIGGEEVNSSPTHTHHRYVINFGDRSEEECRQKWPDLMDIVERKVKPVRQRDKRASYAKYWWQFAEKRGELQSRMKGTNRILFHGFTCQFLQFVFLPSSFVHAGPHNVFLIDTISSISVLQGRIHECWARFFASSMKDDLRYTPSDCFEPFPFPEDWETDHALEEVGREYYEFRAELMVRNNEGLTKTYNRFHDPEERDPDILKLRELHAAMDRTVLDAYGWTDIPTDCEFILDYQEEDEEGAKSRKKKPWRYRWPDEVRDEVLARLLELNAQRAEEEELAGLASGKGRKRTSKAATPAQTQLLELD
jgi:hypothetical protein